MQSLVLLVSRLIQEDNSHLVSCGACLWTPTHKITPILENKIQDVTSSNANTIISDFIFIFSCFQVLFLCILLCLFRLWSTHTYYCTVVSSFGKRLKYRQNTMRTHRPWRTCDVRWVAAPHVLRVSPMWMHFACFFISVRDYIFAVWVSSCF